MKGWRFFSMLAGVASWLAPACLAAQSVRGVVTEGGGVPVPGAVVTLMAEDGRRVATALTSEGGAFSVRAPRSGAYTLEIKRIGVRLTKVGPFNLTEGETREESVTLRAIPLLQPEVRIAGRSRCVRQPDANDVTATLWENARAALAAVKLTEDAGTAHSRITRIARDIDASSLRVTREQRTESFATGSRPFSSVPAESLSRKGYVRRDGNGFLYFAPDANVILSDVFLSDHCFRAAPGEKGDSLVVGLRFEPVDEKAVTDVSGVMWIDRRTYELRSIEFIYENPPPPHERGQAGGSVHFKRIRSGWIVDRWFIRWPRFAGMSRQDPGSSGVVFGNRTSPGVMAYREEGGEAAIIGAEDAGFGTVVGTITDGDLGRPAPGARVLAIRSGFTQGRATAGSDGTFRLDTLPSGTYNITVSHPRLDSLGIRAHSSELQVHASDSLKVALALPRDEVIWTSLCPADSAMADHAILRVLAANGRNGEPLEGMTVRVSWGGAGATGITATTDEDGALTTCNVPYGRSVRVAVLIDGREVVGRNLTLAPAAIVVVPLAVPVVR